MRASQKIGRRIEGNPVRRLIEKFSETGKEMWTSLDDEPPRHGGFLFNRARMERNRGIPKPVLNRVCLSPPPSFLRFSSLSSHERRNIKRNILPFVRSIRREIQVSIIFEAGSRKKLICNFLPDRNCYNTGWKINETMYRGSDSSFWTQDKIDRNIDLLINNNWIGFREYGFNRTTKPFLRGSPK